MNWSLLYLSSEWAIRVVMLIYVPQRRSAAASRTWLLLIFFVPWPGLLMYAVFGRIYVSKRRLELQDRASHHIRVAQQQMIPQAPLPRDWPSKIAPLLALAERLGDFGPLAGNQIELLTDYDGSIERLITDINNARHHVHLVYYIFGDDEIARKVADALAQAVRRGVHCRVLLDAVGSSRALKHLAPGMRARGVEVRAALPVTYFRHNAARFDLRNHRKIVVIDGCIAHTGSQNIVNPGFVKGFPNEELNLRVTGPVVAQFQAAFLADHYLESRQPFKEPELFPSLPLVGSSLAQLVLSGPGYQHENGQELMIALLYSARRRIVITTPYFVPDEPFLQAVRSAGLRDVEVNLVVSAHANQRVTQLAQRSYYEDLLAANVRIHLYQPRFLHAKHLTIDDDLVLIGSTNIDIRSFALNAEVNLLIYDKQIAEQLRVLQQHYFDNSHILQSAEWRQRSLIHRVAENTARLADSLL